MDYKKTIQNIGRDCAAFRKSLNITQEDFAKESGYSQATVSAFEVGSSYSLRLLFWYIRKGYDASRIRDMLET